MGLTLRGTAATTQQPFAMALFNSVHNQIPCFWVPYHISPTSNYFTTWNGLSFGEGSRQVAKAPFRVASPDLQFIKTMFWPIFVKDEESCQVLLFFRGLFVQELQGSPGLYHHKESWMIFKNTKDRSPTNAKKKLEGTTKGTTLDFPSIWSCTNQDTESCTNANRCCEALLTESLKGRCGIQRLEGSMASGPLRSPQNFVLS